MTYRNQNEEIKSDQIFKELVLAAPYLETNRRVDTYGIFEVSFQF